MGVGFDLGQYLAVVHAGHVQVQEHDVRARGVGVRSGAAQEREQLGKLPVPGSTESLPGNIRFSAPTPEADHGPTIPPRPLTFSTG